MSTWSVFRPAHTAHPFALTISNEHTMLVSGLGGYAPDGSISESPREQAEQALRTMSERFSSGWFLAR